jgi:hypothetical protein
MPLWKNTDEAASAPQFTVDTITGNTGVQAFEATPVGTWGVDSTEAQVTNVNGHAGWVLRTVGSGGRSGRVTEETLVAMGSMTSDSEDNVYPDARIFITSQPTNASVTANAGGENVATFTATVTSTPDSATLTYEWQYDNSGTWEAVADGTPANTTYSGEDTAVLEVTPTADDANTAVYRLVVSATGADTVATSNVTLTVVAEA